MGRIRVFIIGTFLLAILAIVFKIYGQPEAAATSGLLAFFFAWYVEKKESANWQILLSTVVSGIFGFTISASQNYVYPIAYTLLISFVFNVRQVFYAEITLKKLPWLELLFISGATAIYWFGNVRSHTDWINWLFPIPLLLFAAYKTIGVFFDYASFKKLEAFYYAADVGKPAPSFTLPDENGDAVSIANFVGRRHLLLIFVRGDWCPTCHIMLRTYEKNRQKFQEKNVVIIAIGPDPIGVNKQMVKSLGLDYKLLSDEKAQAAKLYGTQLQPNAPMTNYLEGIPLPASFLVDTTGTIVYASSPKRAGEILFPDTIFPVLDRLSATTKT